jgi:Flp pilus assembly pilin Flp
MLLATIKFWLSRFGTDQKGVTTVEYAIMLTLIAIPVALSAPGIDDAVIRIFTLTAKAMP